MPVERPTSSHLALLAALLAVIATGCGSARIAGGQSVVDVGACAGAPPGCGTANGTGSALAGGRWSVLPAVPLKARIGPAVAWTGSRLVVWGGSTPPVAGSFRPSPLSDGATYDPSTGAWNSLPAAPLAARTNASSVWTGNEVIIWGGHNAREPLDGREYFADGAAYSPTTGKWQLLPPSPLGPRAGATAVWTGSSVLVFGGFTTSTSTTAKLNDTAAIDGALYDPSARRWTRLPAFPADPTGVPVGVTVAWTGRQLLAWATYEIWHIAGQGASMTSPLVTAAWSPGSSEWRVLPNKAGSAYEARIFGADAFWTGNTVLLVGGGYCLPGMMDCPANTGDGPGGQTYVPATATWGTIPNNAVANAFGADTWSGQALVVLNSGGTGGGVLPGDGAAYDPATNVWAALPPAPITDLRFATMAWTGHQLLIVDASQDGTREVGEALTSSAR